MFQHRRSEQESQPLLDLNSSSFTSGEGEQIKQRYSCGLRLLVCCAKTFLILSLLFLVIVVTFLICYLALKNPPSPPPPRWLIGDVGHPIQVGHRGDSATSRENTLGSLLNASRYGATVVELDIQLSSDGVIVVAHDSQLDNFTNCKGKISELPVVNITNCVVTRGGFKGNTSNAVLHTSFSYSQNQDSEEVPTKWNTVPTLQNFLNESKQLNMNLFIEMKNVYNKSLFLEQIKAHLDLYNYYNKTVMISFFPDLLKGVRNQSPQLFSVLLTRPNSASLYCRDTTFPKSFIWSIVCISPGFWDQVFQTIAPTVANFVGAGALGLEYHSITSETVSDLHKNHFLVMAWTVNTKEEKTKCIDEYVDVLITDCVNRYCPSRDG